MKVNAKKPWLDGSGIELSARRLREITPEWSPATWAVYLKWYESTRREAKVSRRLYDGLLEQQTQTIFEVNNVSSPEGAREFCEQMLGTLPTSESRVIRRLFFDGMTIRRISEVEKISKSRVHRLKDNALSRLREAFQGDPWDTGRIMRGSMSREHVRPTLWDDLKALNLGRGSRVCSPNDFVHEFTRIESESLRAGLKKISLKQRQALYLHFWCALSLEEVARALRIGFNVVGMIIGSALKRLKQEIVKYETFQQN